MISDIDTAVQRIARYGVPGIRQAIARLQELERVGLDAAYNWPRPLITMIMTDKVEYSIHAYRNYCKTLTGEMPSVEAAKGILLEEARHQGT